MQSTEKVVNFVGKCAFRGFLVLKFTLKSKGRSTTSFPLMLCGISIFSELECFSFSSSIQEQFSKNLKPSYFSTFLRKHDAIIFKKTIVYGCLKDKSGVGIIRVY